MHLTAESGQGTGIGVELLGFKWVKATRPIRDLPYLVVVKIISAIATD